MTPVNAALPFSLPIVQARDDPTQLLDFLLFCLSILHGSVFSLGTSFSFGHDFSSVGHVNSFPDVSRRGFSLCPLFRYLLSGPETPHSFMDFFVEPRRPRLAGPFFAHSFFSFERRRSALPRQARFSRPMEFGHPPLQDILP